MVTSTDTIEPADRLGNGRANGAGNVPDELQRPSNTRPKKNRRSVAVPETDSNSGMEVAASESAAASWDESWSLNRRLLAAQAEVSTLDKDATVQGKTKSGSNYSYQAITGDQVVAVGKAALIKHGILFEPDMEKDSTKKDGNKTLVWIHATLRNVDRPDDTKTYGAWGEGVDMAAHGHQKAYTNGVKQILSKALLLTTIGDEQTDGNEAEHVPAGDSPKAREAKAETENTLRAWADTFKAALDACETVEGLKELRAANSHQLKSDQLPDRTREYFRDRIAHLEGILS